MAVVKNWGLCISILQSFVDFSNRTRKTSDNLIDRVIKTIKSYSYSEYGTLTSLTTLFLLYCQSSHRFCDFYCPLLLFGLFTQHKKSHNVFLFHRLSLGTYLLLFFILLLYVFIHDYRIIHILKFLCLWLS